MNSHPSIDAAAGGQRQAMDRMYRFQRHIYDVSRRYYLLGRDRLIESLNVPPGGTVLEVGCGTGRNLLKVAKRYPSARVFGFDISDEMLKSAHSAIERENLGYRVTCAQGDALNFDSRAAFGIEAFDRIYLSYTLSMVPEWKKALEHAVRLVGDRGSLHIADFGQCEALPPLLKSILFAWLKQFHVRPREELRSEISQLAQRLGAVNYFHSGHRGYDWHLSLKVES